MRHAVMDLPAEFYLETVQRVFQDHDLPLGKLTWHGERVKPEAIRRTALPEVRSPQRGPPGALIAGLGLGGLEGTDGPACRALTVQPRHILSPLLVEVARVRESDGRATGRQRGRTELLVLVHVAPPPECRIQKIQSTNIVSIDTDIP